MRKFLLPLALLVSSSVAMAEPPAAEHEGEGLVKPDIHEAHHFCEHVAPEYHINWIDLFHYKESNHHETEKCIETVMEHGKLVEPEHIAHDGNKVIKAEVHAGIIDKDDKENYKPEIYRPKIVGPPYVAALINFLLLIFILVRFAKKPLENFLFSRHDTIKRELEESTKRFTEAQARLAEFESRLKNMEDSRKALMQQYEEQAQREVTKIKEDSERAITKIKADTKREIENALLTAEKTIRREAVDAAISTAESILSKELNQEDRQRLNDQFISRVNAHKNLRGNA